MRPRRQFELQQAIARARDLADNVVAGRPVFFRKAGDFVGFRIEIGNPGQ